MKKIQWKFSRSLKKEKEWQNDEKIQWIQSNSEKYSYVEVEKD